MIRERELNPLCSVTIVAMVGVTRPSNLSQTECMDRFGEEEEMEAEGRSEGEFEWDTPQQQMLLGSYYWGYTAAQIPSAWLATKESFI